MTLREKPSAHSDEVLYIYPSKTTPGGWWCPRYGDVPIPEGWELLPPGDAFVTRQVKQMGPYWLAKKPVPRKEYTRTLGIWTPRQNIETARRLAEQTEKRREARRALSREQREKQDARYREQLVQEAYEYLDFAPEHEALARKVAKAATQYATKVGSRRVGRTKKLTVKQKAELAVRAYIRHKYTDYEGQLIEREAAAFGKLPDYEYREIKAEAESALDEFLVKHRKRK